MADLDEGQHVEHDGAGAGCQEAPPEQADRQEAAALRSPELSMAHCLALVPLNKTAA